MREISLLVSKEKEVWKHKTGTGLTRLDYPYEPFSLVTNCFLFIFVKYLHSDGKKN